MPNFWLILATGKTLQGIKKVTVQRELKVKLDVNLPAGDHEMKLYLMCVALRTCRLVPSQSLTLRPYSSLLAAATRTSARTRRSTCPRSRSPRARTRRTRTTRTRTWSDGRPSLLPKKTCRTIVMCLFPSLPSGSRGPCASARRTSCRGGGASRAGARWALLQVGTPAPARAHDWRPPSGEPTELVSASCSARAAHAAVADWSGQVGRPGRGLRWAGAPRCRTNPPPVLSFALARPSCFNLQLPSSSLACPRTVLCSRASPGRSPRPPASASQPSPSPPRPPPASELPAAARCRPSSRRVSPPQQAAFLWRELSLPGSSSDP